MTVINKKLAFYLSLGLLTWVGFKMWNIEVVARTIWGEARGEGRQGMEAVAAVIMNRYHSSAWYTAPTVAGVAMKQQQFSAWNPSDPNYNLMINVTRNDPYFALAMEIAGEFIIGSRFDPTGGATHYYASPFPPPNWAKKGQLTVQIGKHLFYKGVA